MKLNHELLGPVDLPEEPKRVVSLAPNITATIFALGAGERLLGRSAFCWRPPAAQKLPVLSSYTKVRWDQLAALAPEVIFTTAGVQRDLTIALHERGYAVWSFPLPTSPWGIVENVSAVAAFLGTSGTALAGALAEKYLQLAGSLAGVRVYLEYQLGEPITIGRGAFMHAALAHLGAVNVFADRASAYFPPPLAEVMARGPDLLVFEPKRIANREAQLARIAAELEERGWRNVAWLATGGDELSHSGPEFFDYLASFAEAAQRRLQ